MIWEKCAAKGLDPFSATIDLLDHEDVSVRLTASKNLMPYLLPQLQRGEVDVGENLKRVLEHRYGRAEPPEPLSLVD